MTYEDAIGQTFTDPDDSADNYECDGHESTDGAHMSESTYCDGSCNPMPTFTITDYAEGFDEDEDGKHLVIEIEGTDEHGCRQNFDYYAIRDQLKYA